MKWITLIILILLSTIVLAEENVKKTYKPNEIIDLGLHLTNGTGDVIGANCSTQIRNETYDVVDESIMNEIGGGYYNYTYNTSRIGKYFCRQNCTQGSFYDANTCDFIVGGEDSMLLGMIVFIPLFIAGFLLIVSWMLPSEKYWALKIGLILLGFVFIFQAYQYGSMAIAKLYNYTEMIDAIGDSTFIYAMVFWFVVGIMLITFIYDIFMIFSGKKHKTGDYEE